MFVVVDRSADVSLDQWSFTRIRKKSGLVVLLN